MENDRSTRTLFAALLIVAAVLVSTNYAVRRTPLTEWWLPAVLFVLGALVALPIQFITRQAASAESSGSSALAVKAGTSAVRVVDTADRKPTAADVAQTVRPAPQPGPTLENAPAGAIMDEHAAPVHDDAPTQTPAAPVAPPPTASGSAPAAGSGQPEIPTEGINTAESPAPTSSDAQSRIAKSESSGDEMPNQTGVTGPELTDEPGYRRQTTADEGLNAAPDGTPIAETPAQPAPTAEPPILPDPPTDITDEPADTSAAIAPASGGQAVTTDDLVRLDGIGPRIAGVLVEANIDTFAKLAATPEERLREILTDAGIRLVSNLVTWPEQAAFAMKGDWEGLDRYVAETKNRE
ncbi:MAG: hypothetical protein SF162_06355 [bacterium]|nr:hypothetical protein [bacterium]